MSGVSLFGILDYSIRTATFEKQQSEQAAQLLQVAGLRITYSDQLPSGSSRLLAVDVLTKKKKKWKALNPAGLYTFATMSYECGAYQPYPTLTGTDGSFSIQGEVGGTIGEKLVQDVVREFLGHLSEPYNTTLGGRIVGVPSLEGDVLDFFQEEENCGTSQYFAVHKRICRQCPSWDHVTFSDEVVHFEHQLGRTISLEALDKELNTFGQEPTNGTNANTTISFSDGDNSDLVARILLTNREPYNVTVIPKLIPLWLQMIPGEAAIQESISEGQNYPIIAGGSMAINLVATPSKATDMAGSVVGTVAFRLLGDQSVDSDPGIDRCDEFTRDLTFDASLTILPQQELNHLGNIRFVGLSLMALVMALSVGFALFVFIYRGTRIISFMQPPFLMVICLGIFIMSSTIVPLSFGDGIISPEQCSNMCIAQPWLTSIGMTILFSVLFSKLWWVLRLLVCLAK